MEVIIERQICISVPNQFGKPWVVDKIEMVDGVEFIQLAQANRDFQRFVGGKHGKQDWTGLKDIRQLRHDASMAALVPSDGLFNNERLQKRAKKEARSKKDELPPHVLVELPAIAGEGPLSVKMLPSIDVNSVLCVELTSPALSRIRQIIRATAENNEASECKLYQRSSIPSSVVRWHGTKGAFIATRKVGGRQTSKLFRPKEPNSPSKAAAKEEAWVEPQVAHAVALLQPSGPSSAQLRLVALRERARARQMSLPR